MKKMEDYDIISDHSCNEEVYYSDQIDSDIEAELYGLIHHDAQDNSISLQDKSDSVESKSVSLHDKSNFTENNSVLQQNSLCPTDNNSVSLLTNSVPSEGTANSSKKLKKSAKKDNRNCNNPVQNNCKDLFCSDAIVSTNLYYSFESPARKKKIQNNPVQSGKSKRNVVDKPAKRKSDVVSEILGNIQLKKNINSLQPENSVSKRKKNNHNNISIMEEDDSFVEVIDESSESDCDSSIIFLEPDESNLQTNIEKEAVVLSSDAEDSDSSMEKSFSRACQRKLTANFSSNNKDPWHINDEDRFRAKKQSNRYHETAVLMCSNCESKGHSAKFCSIPKALKCFFCGDYHAAVNCRKKMCKKCFKQGHDSKHCSIRYFPTCNLCRMKGHSALNCPDIWRRYHMTTSKGNIVKGNSNPDYPLYCYNCGSKGHYGANCKEYRRDRWSFPTLTSVISYADPTTVRQEEKERNFHEGRRFDRMPFFRRRRGNEAFSNDTSTRTQNIRRKKKRKYPKTPPNTNHQSTTTPKNAVQKEVYFPRTPKAIPTSSTDGFISRKFKILQQKEERMSKQQLLHRVGLQQRLGLSFP